MNMKSLSAFLDTLVDEGLAAYGFACVEGTTHSRYTHLPFAVSLVFRLSNAVLDEITTEHPVAPTYSYFQHYRAANAYLDNAALRVAAHIERMGARALPVAASQSVPDLGTPHTGVFQHKTAAVLSGLGWIGKSALFVSPEYGPRVRLATVLTDQPLPVAAPVQAVPCCGECMVCVSACPAHAITGESYVSGLPRTALFDAQACSDHMRSHYMKIGRGAVCGICVACCPLGR